MMRSMTKRKPKSKRKPRKFAWPKPVASSEVVVRSVTVDEAVIKLHGRAALWQHGEKHLG